MITLTKAIFFRVGLRMLQLMQPVNAPETVPLEDVAWAQTEVTNTPDQFVMLTVQAENESHFSKRVQEGACANYECDPIRQGGVVIGHKAHGIWQVQDDRDGELWENAVGLNREALLAGAKLANRRLRNRCRNLTEAYSAQTGQGCVELALGKKRARRHAELLKLWYRAQAQVEAELKAEQAAEKASEDTRQAQSN